MQFTNNKIWGLFDAVELKCRKHTVGALAKFILYNLQPKSVTCTLVKENSKNCIAVQFLKTKSGAFLSPFN